MYKKDAEQIQDVITDYFEGIFNGDIIRLRSAFHPRALLFGDINDQPYLKNVEEYLEGVKNRKSPFDLGESFSMKILAIEILGHIASVKLHVPMLGFNYYDFLSFSKSEGNWTIVNKIFTNVKI